MPQRPLMGCTGELHKELNFSITSLYREPENGKEKLIPSSCGKGLVFDYVGEKPSKHADN